MNSQYAAVIIIGPLLDVIDTYTDTLSEIRFARLDDVGSASFSILLRIASHGKLAFFL